MIRQQVDLDSTTTGDGVFYRSLPYSAKDCREGLWWDDFSILGMGLKANPRDGELARISVIKKPLVKLWQRLQVAVVKA